ncbi:MAG TPA: hypothetical protein VKV17_08620 [Bryobacteraceae bacterium]|nr:hypothetical protein [Bryobacteraceae bacterium]
MHKILENGKRLAVLATFGLLAGWAFVPGALAQGAAAQQTKKVKDQGEYDLYNNAAKEKSDPVKKEQYLDQWVQKYPDTDYQEERLQLYGECEQMFDAAKNADKAAEVSAKIIDLGQKILAKDPKSLVALTLIPANVQKLPNPTPDQLSAAQNAAQTLLANLDSLKPASATDAQWNQAKPQLQAVAKTTIEWIETKPARDATNKKDLPGAEAAWTKIVQAHPDNGEYAYQLGSVLISEKDPNKVPLAIYEIARSLEVQGLPQANRAQVEAYLTKIYNAYHGADEDGLKQLRAMAKASPLPGPDYKLKTAAEIAAEKEEEFKEKNPQLALWLGIKKQLADPANGQQYFDTQMKGTGLPKLKGTLVEAKPACRPKELVLAMSDSTHPEVTLKLDMPLTNKPDLGKEIEFDMSEPTAFVQDPFNLTLETEKDKIEGITGEACAAPRAPVRKGVAKKKAASE